MKLRLLSKIGDGGFGDVWKAKDELGRFVAVKIVREAGAAVSSALDHARALARAKHQNVVSVLSLETIRDPDTKKQVDAIVMELVEGTTLTKRLSGPKFSIGEARKIGKSIANGIGHIHEQGMEHGDLHSDNVMVTEGGAKVIDILYRDSLAMLSSGSREIRLRRDRTNLRLLLQQIIVHSELGAEEATEFNNMIDETASATQIKDSFLKIASAANHSDRVRLLDHAYGRVIDGGFAEGDAYAEALLGETPIGVTLPLLKRIVEEKSYHPNYAQGAKLSLPAHQKRRMGGR
jgi:serine/threonine protein kinase